MKKRLKPSTSLVYVDHVEAHLTLNGRNIPFVNHVKYLGVIFDRKIIGRLNIDTIEAKVFRTFLTDYPLFKSERLNANIKIILHKTLIRSILIYACPAWEFATDTHLLKLQRLKNQCSLHHRKFSKVHTGPQFTCRFQNSVRLWLLSQNYAGSKQKSYKIIIIQMFATLDKAKPNRENIRGENLAAVKRTTVQVTKLPLKHTAT
jgi:hypothetical protein